jgi:hypothetical protein
MAHSPRDVETEMVDLVGLSPSEIDTLEPDCLAQALTRVLASHADPADPLLGGSPKGPSGSGPPEPR